MINKVTMSVGDIVEYTDKATCMAAVFCKERGITGVVKEINCDLFYVIDVGFSYKIYVREDEIRLVAKASEVPLPYEGY